MNAARPQRVLMTADPIGGAWSYALELTGALNEYGVEVALATMGARLSREQRREVKALPNLELFESAFKLEWMEDPWEDLQHAGEWLLELERRLAPQVVHLNSYAHAPLPWQAPCIVFAHSCVCSWWRAVRGGRPPELWDRYSQIVKAGLLSASLVVAPSYAMLAQLSDLYGPFEGRVVFNGRDPACFQPGKKQPFIFSTGRLCDEGKNINALAQVSPRLSWPIYVAGRQKQSSRKRFASSSFHLTGRLSCEEISRWFATASIYAVPTRYEPFGLSILEAGLAGCGLVLGNIPSLRELWSGAAQFVDPDDPEQLLATLRNWIDHPNRLREWASYAQCRAIQFTPADMARRYLALYREVMGISRELPHGAELVCQP